MSKKSKPKKGADQTQQAKRRGRPPGRLLSAWSVLLGQRLTPIQIEAEWVDYKAIFSDLLGRHSAMLARHAKAEKERIDRAFASLETGDKGPIEADSGTDKDALRSKIFAGRFGQKRPMPPPPPTLEETA